MIETEDQRRWWFATHPEYSWSHRGISRHGQRERDGSSHYKAQGPGFLADSRGNPLRTSWFCSYEDGWLRLTANYPGGTMFMRRLPTTWELVRWPKEMAKAFFRWLDAMLRNNPMLIDPNQLQRHHGLPIEFIKYFLDCGMEIEEFIIIMRLADHRLKPDGLHTGQGRGGKWNTEWREFINDNPPENSRKQQDKIKNKLEKMKKKYGINEKALLPPAPPRGR